MTDMPPLKTMEDELGLVHGKTILHFVNENLDNVPVKYDRISDGQFFVYFEGNKESTSVHPSRVVFDSTPVFVKPCVVKQAQEPKAKQQPVKVVCQFSIKDFQEAFPDAVIYARSGAKFDHPNFDVLSHTVLFDDKVKACFNSYNGIIFGKLDTDEYDKLKQGIWTKATSAINDRTKVIAKLVEGGYVKYEEKQ